MKKTLSTILIASMFLSGCGSSNLVFKGNRIEKNNQYCSFFLKDKNPKNKKGLIKIRLRNKEKTTIQLDYSDLKNFNIGKIDSLNENQLIRVYNLLISLENKEFREKIGEQIILDLLDPQVYDGFSPSERLGVVRVRKNLLYLVPIQSVQSKEKLDSTKYNEKNSECTFPDGALDYPNFIQYHIHATRFDCSKFCGPSLSMTRLGWGGDLGLTIREILKYGESHATVITKLKGDKFNIFYYGGKKKGERNLVDIINLGDWEY